MPSQTHQLKPNSPLWRRILEAVETRVSASKSAYSKQHRKWQQNEEDALAYLPEVEIDAHRRLARERGKPEVTTLKIPYSYGILMASHTYWTSVFMSRTPINQFTGRHGESQQQIQALEALIDYQVQVGQMLVPWYMWLLDAGKYGLGVIDIGWVDEFSVVSQIEETPDRFLGVLDTGRTTRRKFSQRIPGYSGNRITNIRPYDFFPDPRVPVRFFQKGEFCAARMELGWNTILKRLEQGYYISEAVDILRNREVHGNTYDYRVEGSSQIDLPEPQAFYVPSDSSGSKKQLNNAVVSVVECTIELVPSDWGLGRGTYPEKWVFTTTSDYHVVLGVQPLGANHDKFQFAVLEYEPEGYSLTARGVPEVLKPINDTMDWLINSHLYNVRKALNDQFIVDPERIELSDLENPQPGGAIRLSPGAYGDDVRTVLTQLPVSDVTRTHLTDLQAMFGVGQRAVGISDQLMGQIATAGRRSATEVRTGAGFGINRLKTTSEYFSAMGWSPMAQMLVQNSQQYYEAEKQFKIVGQLMQEAGQEFINVSPEDILGFYDFIPVDGSQPIDRLAQATLWNQLLGQLRNFPDILAQYDMGRIFEWVAQLAGLKNISQFRVELAPDEQLLAQAQAGNVVPLAGGPNGNGGNPAPTQAPLQSVQGGPNPV